MKIKIGSTRIVLVLNKIVIKVPIAFSWRRFISGTASNYNEALIWEATTLDQFNGQENRQYLAEVYSNIGGLILVCERINELTEEEFSQMSSFYKTKLLSLLLDRKEFIHKNIGKIEINGMIRYKILDYGINLNRTKQRFIYQHLRIVREKLSLG